MSQLNHRIIMCYNPQDVLAPQSGGGGLGGPGVRWRVDRDDVASVFPRQRAALLALAGRSTRARHLSSLIITLAPPRVMAVPAAHVTVRTATCRWSA